MSRGMKMKGRDGASIHPSIMKERKAFMIQAGIEVRVGLRVTGLAKRESWGNSRSESRVDNRSDRRSI